MSGIKRMNAYLGKHGFSPLTDPNVIPQLALMISDHERFRKLLVTVEPDKRLEAYEALRPHLRFEAKPLDVYVAEAADIAARSQEQSPLEMLAQDAIRRNQRDLEARGVFTLVCERCTKEAHFRAKNRYQGAEDAKQLGWVKDSGKIYCPECDKARIVIVHG